MPRAMAFAALLFGFTFAIAADKKNLSNLKVAGIDVMERKLTVDEGKGKEVTYDVLKTAKVTVSGTKGKKLEDVRLNFLVNLKLDKNDKVTEIEAFRMKNKK